MTVVSIPKENLNALNQDVQLYMVIKIVQLVRNALSDVKNVVYQGHR